MPPDTLIREEDRDLLGHSEAVYSADLAHRYLLIRRWHPGGPTAVFIMLNPSTATAFADDPTIRRCIGFARRERCHALTLVNLFSARATAPLELLAHPAPNGDRNDEFIEQHCQPGWLIIAAWGAHGVIDGRARTVTTQLAGRGIALSCLGRTATGQPRHPLYVRATAPLIPFEARTATFGPTRATMPALARLSRSSRSASDEAQTPNFASHYDNVRQFVGNGVLP